jgi:hypothetical protein
LLEVNDIRSFHGRDIENVIGPVAQKGSSILKWVDKDKGLTWLSSASQQVQQESVKKDLISATKVVESFVNPATEQQNSSIKQNSPDQNPLFNLLSGQNQNFLTSMILKNLLENNSTLNDVLSTTTKSDNPMMQIMSGLLNNKKSPPKSEDKIEKIISDNDSFEEI